MRFCETQAVCGYNVRNIFKEGPQNRNVAFRIKSIV